MVTVEQMEKDSRRLQESSPRTKGCFNQFPLAEALIVMIVVLGDAVTVQSSPV